MGITKFDASPKLFAGQGDLIIFDFKTGKNYDNVATLADFDAPKSLGQIVQDSTSWDGEDVQTTQIKDEQGDLITAKVTAGTVAFSFEIASTSKAMINKFLNKGNHDVSAVSCEGFAGQVTATGFGVDLPVFTAPIAVVNDELNRVLFIPKAKITSNLSLADGLWRIKANVLAEYIKTSGLYTAMVIEGNVSYTAENNGGL